MEQLVQKFNKYKEHGAYHWRELENNLKRYNAGLAARYNLSKKIILKNCNKPKIIVDIGCGDGFLTALLAQTYKDSQVTGFDFDETGIRLANEKTNKLALSNLTFLHENAFDHIKKANLIVATDVIEHIYNQDEFMMNCFSILDDDGFLFLSTPVRYKEFPDDKYHIHEFFGSELENFSELFGFSVAEHRYSHDYCYVEKYNKAIKLMGIGKMRLFKYLYNFSAIYLNKNVFEQMECKLPIMHYILLKKA